MFLRPLAFVNTQSLAVHEQARDRLLNRVVTARRRLATNYSPPPEEGVA